MADAGFLHARQGDEPAGGVASASWEASQSLTRALHTADSAGMPSLLAVARRRQEMPASEPSATAIGRW